MMGESEIPSEIQVLVDRQAIHDALLRYCRGVDRNDRDLLLSAYHDDAWDDHGVYCGPAGSFADWAFDYHNKYQNAHHHYILNHNCELDDTVAHTETYFLFAGVNRDKPDTILSGGRYIDRFEKRDGRWAIAARKCLIEWSGTLTDVDFAAEHLAALGSSGTSARDRSDSSYERPLQVTREEQTFPY